jgi:TolB-like protein/class 3 adenylate cyclase/Tfp pilus assembly protein PilF
MFVFSAEPRLDYLLSTSDCGMAMIGACKGGACVLNMSAELKPDLQLEIAHLLLIDVVGYSKLLVNEQIELVQELNQIVRRTECFQVAEKSGKLIRVPTGDGMALVFFRSPEEPVQCALEISKALKDSPNIQLRMGVHSGPISQVTDVNDRVNVAGTGLNVAQRVMDCGDAGHILLSKHLADDLAQYRHWQPYLHDVGECEVKHGLRLHIVNLYKDGLGNPALPGKLGHGKRWKQTTTATVRPISAPVWPKRTLIVALLLSALALAISFSIFFRRGSPNVTRTLSEESIASPIPEKSIAVMPFENRSEEKSNAYFADSIQDEILTRLAKIADLKVISRTSTQHYKSKPENLHDIARQLGVAHILEGSVQKSGDAVRVNVQLIKAANDSHLWADTFDRKLTDIFSVETEVAKAIADQLRAKLSGQEEQVIASKPTDNPQAYDAYLRGLAYTLKPATTVANTLGAQKHLREAVALDSTFALCWALLSYVDSVSYLSFPVEPTIALRDEARHAAETALTLQPDLREAMLAEGYYYYAFLKDYDTAVSYFERARSLLPNSSKIPEALAYVARRRGQWDRSDAYFNEAERLDPRNVNLLTQHALLDIERRNFSLALRKLDYILDITPGDVDTLAYKAAVAQAEGDLRRASAMLDGLRPTADQHEALETQVYQAILKRQPAPMIRRLTEILTKPDPALGYLNGELRFWLGWAQEVAGDKAAAQQSWRQARSELESFLNKQPDNISIIADLTWTNLGLGDPSAALAVAERAAATFPLEKDAINGSTALDIVARCAALKGDHDRAISVLQKLLSIPHTGALASGMPLTPALLQLDPMFDGLRNDPRFQKLVGAYPHE